MNNVIRTICAITLMLGLPPGARALEIDWTIVEDPFWASLSMNTDGLLDGPTGPQTDGNFLLFGPPANGLNLNGTLAQTFWDPTIFVGPPGGFSLGFGEGTFTMSIDEPGLASGTFTNFNSFGSVNTFDGLLNPVGTTIPSFPLTLTPGGTNNITPNLAGGIGVSNFDTDTGTGTINHVAGTSYWLPQGVDPFTLFDTDIAEHFDEVVGVLDTNATVYDYVLLQHHDLFIGGIAGVAGFQSTTAYGVASSVVPIPPALPLLAAAIGFLLVHRGAWRTGAV